MNLHRTVTLLILSAFLTQAIALDGSHVDARAVSVHYRHGWDGFGAACCECYESVPKGSVVLYTIRDCAVTRADTIHSLTQGFGQYPAFNYAATKVAFFRYGTAPVAPDPDPPTCTDVNGGKRYISIVNIDGTGLRDLCELSGEPGSEQSLDWSAGDWIYFVNPSDYRTQYGPKQGETVDIWKVNAVTGQAEQVCNLTDNSGQTFQCSWVRRFSIDANSQYAGMQIFGDTYGCTLPSIQGGGNSVYRFPFSGCNLEASQTIGHCCCNMAISPGASLIGWYMGGAHSDIYIERIDPEQGVTSDAGMYHMDNDLGAWAGEDLGGGAELIRWSVNSDKWVLQNFGWHGHAGNLYNGSNAVVCNWVDHVAINISKNPKLSTAGEVTGGDGTIFLNNCAGDYWIDGGADNANKYEDEQGVWHTVANASTEYVPVGGSVHSVRTSFARTDPAAAVVRAVTDVRGRTLRRTDALSPHGRSVPAGIRVVHTVNGKASLVVR